MPCLIFAVHKWKAIIIIIIIIINVIIINDIW